MLIRDQHRILAHSVEQFKDILNRESVISDDAISQLPQSSIIEELNSPPTVTETIGALKQMSSGKAAEADGIPQKDFKCGGNILPTHLTQLFIAILNTKTVPQEYKDAMIVHLYKHLGNQFYCDNHRGIFLLSIAGKIPIRVIVMSFFICPMHSR